MPYTSPAAPVSGAVISKTTFGDVVKADLDYLANPPACLAYHNTTQSIPNNVLTALVFNSETYDTNNLHSTSVNTNRITIQTAGLYVITANFTWPTNGTGERHGIIRTNGTNIIAEDSKNSGSVTGNVGHSVSATDKFVVGDYIEVLGLQTSGGALNVNTTPRFTATWIGLG